jgi:hypothetical protein
MVSTPVGLGFYTRLGPNFYTIILLMWSRPLVSCKSPARPLALQLLAFLPWAASIICPRIGGSQKAKLRVMGAPGMGPAHPTRTPPKVFETIALGPQCSCSARPDHVLMVFASGVFVSLPPHVVRCWL